MSAAWTRPHGDELHVAVRSLAGCLSRLCAVDVVVPGARTAPWADGAFDPIGTGQVPAGRTWARADTVRAALATWRADRRPPEAVMVDAEDDEALALAGALWPAAPVLAVGAGAHAATPATFAPDGVLAVDVPQRAPAPHARPDGPHVVEDAGLGDVARSAENVRRTGLFLRVHPGAGDREHYELRGSPGYLLVLGDRTGISLGPWPSERSRWLLTRFPRQHVVVVEGGAATLWRSRSCVRRFEVHTRMDLWLLVAHAWAVVDLLPGTLFARECVESLRYGVPVVVPTGSAAAGLAGAGAGLQFATTRELLACVETLEDPAQRAAIAAAGRLVADRWYGDPRRVVERLEDALSAIGVRLGDR